MARSTRIVIDQLRPSGPGSWRGEVEVGAGRMWFERRVVADTFDRVLDELTRLYHDLVPAAPTPPPQPAPDVPLRPTEPHENNVRGRTEVARLREIRPAAAYKRGDDPGPEAA
jgi:hypothetical protein